MDIIFAVDLWFGVVASFVIPFICTRLIRILQDWGNPPWLKKQQKPYYSAKTAKIPPE